jgi:hypothetical protein
MDVDHIPAGVDFVAHLNRQLAACDPDDFVAIEIAAALAARDPPGPSAPLSIGVGGGRIWGVKSHHRLRRLVGGRSF